MQENTYTGCFVELWKNTIIVFSEFTIQLLNVFQSNYVAEIVSDIDAKVEIKQHIAIFTHSKRTL